MIVGINFINPNYVEIGGDLGVTGFIYPYDDLARWVAGKQIHFIQ